MVDNTAEYNRPSPSPGCIVDKFPTYIVDSKNKTIITPHDHNKMIYKYFKQKSKILPLLNKCIFFVQKKLFQFKKKIYTL